MKAKGVQLKISSGFINSTELAVLEQKKSQHFLPLPSHVSLLVDAGALPVCSPLLPSLHHAFFALLILLLAVNLFSQVLKSAM